MSLQKLLPARLSAFADATDPAALAIVARVRGALDRLFAPLTPETAAPIIRDLLALFAYDGIALLEAMTQRARERIMPAFAPPSEGELAQAAFGHVRDWATAVTQAWRTRLVTVDPAAAQLAMDRVERALDAGDAAVKALLDDVRLADEATRLATAYAARTLLEHDSRRLERALEGRLTGAVADAVNAFVDEQRSPEQRAAFDVLVEIDRAQGYVGSVAQLLGGYKPLDPLAA